MVGQLSSPPDAKRSGPFEPARARKGSAGGVNLRQTAHQTTTELRPTLGLPGDVAKCPAIVRPCGRETLVRSQTPPGEGSGVVSREVAPSGLLPMVQNGSRSRCAHVGKPSHVARLSAPLGNTRISGREQRPRPLRSEKRGRFYRAQRPAKTQYSPGAVLPRHVLACQHSEHRAEKWFVWTWKRDAPLVQTRVPYSCQSWRCPVCARHEAAVTFARIREATSRKEYAADGWVFFVLTLDRDGYYTGKPWLDVNDAYRSLSTMSRKLLKRLRRNWSEPCDAWIAVVEAHKSGWPHVNLMLYAPELARELSAEKSRRLDAGEDARRATLLHGDLLEHAMACGWGRQSVAEAARDKEALASYIVKLAGTHDDSVGELAKITQAPTNAPKKFRRLRSAKGFLPPRHKNPNITGALVRRRRSTEGDWQILRLNPPHDPAQLEPTERAVVGELHLIREEEALLAKCRGTLPPMPPLRVAVGGTVETVQEATERRWSEKLRAFESA